jgi:lipid II:glycine glycyltransferase (peptidoglycan interpeptide bridge formation enzyme)
MVHTIEHFLQSEYWQRFNEALGKKTITATGQDFRYLAIIEKTRLGTRLYCPYGPVFTSNAGFEAALVSLKTEAKLHGALYIRIEPTQQIGNETISKFGLKKAHKDIQPLATMLNDVTTDEATIMANVSQTVRRVWRKNQKREISFRNSHDVKDIELFIDMSKGVSDRTGIRQHSAEYFNTLAHTLFPSKSAGIMIADYESKPAAAILYLQNKSTMYYSYAASYDTYRSFNIGTSLALHALLVAHKRNKRCFDFYGVAPKSSNGNHPWSGFTRFKQSFGGEYTEYAGTWELPVNNVRYAIYRGGLATYKTLRSAKSAVKSSS